MPVMTIRGYARHRGVSHTAVEKAVKQGRIRTTADGKIDAEQADRDWSRNSSPAEAKKPASRESAPADNSLPGPSYAQSRAVRELYEARLAKIEYEERIKKLVNTDEVSVAAYNLHRMLRDRMLNVPDRVVGAVLAEVRAAATALGLDPEQLNDLEMSRVHGILMAEIRTILEEFADAIAHR